MLYVHAYTYTHIYIVDIYRVYIYSLKDYCHCFTLKMAKLRYFSPFYKRSIGY